MCTVRVQFRKGERRWRRNDNDRLSSEICETVAYKPHVASRLFGWIMLDRSRLDGRLQFIILLTGIKRARFPRVISTLMTPSVSASFPRFPRFPAGRKTCPDKSSHPSLRAVVSRPCLRAYFPHKMYFASLLLRLQARARP